MSLFNVCFPGVQTPDRPEGPEEGQWEEQAQCWSAEPEHHHVWGLQSSPSIHWLTMWCKKSGMSDIQFYDSFHFHTDTEVPVEDTL